MVHIGGLDQRAAVVSVVEAWMYSPALEEKAEKRQKWVLRIVDWQWKDVRGESVELLAAVGRVAGQAEWPCTAGARHDAWRTGVRGERGAAWRRNSKAAGRAALPQWSWLSVSLLGAGSNSCCAATHVHDML